MLTAEKYTSEENDEGIVADPIISEVKVVIEAEMDQQTLKELEISMQLEYSFKLSRPLTALTYFSKDCCLISGSFGMVLDIVAIHNFNCF